MPVNRSGFNAPQARRSKSDQPNDYHALVCRNYR